jgi:type IV secretory pathway component VirB8
MECITAKNEPKATLFFETAIKQGATKNQIYHLHITLSFKKRKI